ncbi:MAG: NADH-quinone oxidoreductase subunit C [candidate division KSB1 bacterium]|nr:NADH-quinone oxidoreductase subunit C [candidate division KSB1 bacterium]
MEEREHPAVARLREAFGEKVLDVYTFRGDTVVVLDRSVNVEACQLLRDDPQLQFNFLMDLTAVDYLGFNRKPRFEVVYNLYSLANNLRLRLRVPVPEEDPIVRTVSHLWKAANWAEREVWDMFGIRFEGHPNLKRILLYEEFEGHPLRKDYPVNRRQPLVGPRN